MRLTTIPALFLGFSLAVVISCSSSSDPESTPTPTFDPPPGVTPASTAEPTATAEAPPEPTAVPSGTGTAGQAISIDNVATLSEAGAGLLAEPFSRMTWRGDGLAAFVASRHSVMVLMPDAAELTTVLTVPEPEWVLDVSSDGVVAVASDAHTIALRDTSQDAVLKTLSLPESVTAARFSPDGNVLAVTIADQIVTQLWDVDTGSKVEDVTGFETAAPVYAAEFGPAGRSLIWLSRAHAQVTDLVTDQLSPAVTEDDFIGGIALSPAEKVLATAAGASLTLWDLETGDILDVFDLPDIVSGLTYSPDGRLLFVGTASQVVVLQLPLLTPAGNLPVSVQSLALSPDGAGLAIVDKDGVARMYLPR